MYPEETTLLMKEKERFERTSVGGDV